MLIRRYSQQLCLQGNILGLKEETRTGVIQAVWNYIKLQDLQDKIDRRIIRLDGKLKQVSIFVSYLRVTRVLNFAAFFRIRRCFV